MNAVGQAIELVLFFYILCLLGRLVADWIQMFARGWTPRGPLLLLLEAIYTVTDPPIKLVRRVLPPLRLGGVAIDISFFVVLLIAYLLRLLNQQLLLT